MQIVQENGHESETPTSPDRFRAIAETWGVHGALACAVLCLQLGLPWLLAPDWCFLDMMQLVGLVLFPVAYLTQRYRFDKVHGIALAKALGVSLLHRGTGDRRVWVMLALGLMGAFVVYPPPPCREAWRDGRAYN